MQQVTAEVLFRDSTGTVPGMQGCRTILINTVFRLTIVITEPEMLAEHPVKLM